MRVVQKPRVEGLPDGYVVEYFGKISSNIYFVICRPANSRHLLDFMVFIGPEEDLSRVEINAIKEYPDGELRNIETVRGNFWFPSRRTRDKMLPTFNTWPIEFF